MIGRAAARAVATMLRTCGRAAPQASGLIVADDRLATRAGGMTPATGA
jgi:hypothetical protein